MDGSANPRQELKIMQTLVEMSFDVATDEQYAELEVLVQENELIRRQVVTALTHLADLEWEGRGRLPSDSPYENMQRDFEEQPLGAVQARCEAAGRVELRQRPEPSVSPRTRRRSLGAWAGICGVFVLGASAALWIVYQRDDDHGRHGDFAIQAPGVALPVATLVSNTSYMWDAREGTAMEPGARLQAGQSVVLLDGIAEIAFQSGATTRMQGPAMFSFDAAGTLELKYGKFLVTNVGNNRHSMKIPLARCVTTEGTSVGIDAFGGEVVVHVLEGRSTLLPDMERRDRIMLSSGEAVRLFSTARSEVGVYHSGADPKAFDFEAMADVSQIRITPEYVELLKQSAPVAYWRFEELVHDRVANEMRKGHELLRLGDKVEIVARGENRLAEFVVRETPGSFVAIGKFDELTGHAYSIEFWAKPSHYHRGAIASLVEQSTDDRGSIERHGLIVEIESANLVLRKHEGQPRAIRFHHRSPPQDGLAGTSCDSPGPYKTQKWQHIAVVKEGAAMRLYVDGELVSTAEDATPLTKNLSLIVGQLFSFGTVRPFVGQLDEMAVYDRALSPEEIRRRVQLVHEGDAVTR